MERVPRERFVPEHVRHLAYEDGALPIGNGQTISQPFIVATICQLLGLAADDRVLDVGTGSGYQAAVLAELAAEVVTIERVPELAKDARAALVRGRVRQCRGSRGRRVAGRCRPSAVRRDRSRSGRTSDPSHAVRAARRRREARRSARRTLGSTARRGRAHEAGPVERSSVPCRFVPLVGAEGFGDS